MKTPIAFNGNTLNDFEERTGKKLTLDFEQQSSLRKTGSAPLTIEQLKEVIAELCPDVDSLKDFIESEIRDLQPISMSIFVVNPKLWQIMSRKPRHADRMLPIATIPWIYWSSRNELYSNPYGVTRFEHKGLTVSLDMDKIMLTIEGNGGEFCGLLEKRFAEHRIKGRPLLVPEFPFGTEVVPMFEHKKITVKLLIEETKTQLYPKPHKEFDYIFSESPRVFRNHGIELSTKDSNCLFQAGRGKQEKLFGEVFVLLGRPTVVAVERTETLRFHLWLAAVEYLVETIQRREQIWQ